MTTQRQTTMHARLTQSPDRETLIRAYLRRELDEDANEAFELCLMEDPALLDDVELEAKLQEGLRASRELAPSATSLRPRKTSWLALAASLLAGIVLGTALQRLPSDARGLTLDSPELLVVPAERGASSDGESIVASSSRGSLIVQWPAPLAPSRVRVVIDDTGGRRTVPLAVSPDGTTISVLVARDGSSAARMAIECEIGSVWRACGRTVEIR